MGYQAPGKKPPSTWHEIRAPADSKTVLVGKVRTESRHLSQAGGRYRVYKTQVIINEVVSGEGLRRLEGGT